LRSKSSRRGGLPQNGCLIGEENIAGYVTEICLVLYKKSRMKRNFETRGTRKTGNILGADRAGEEIVMDKRRTAAAEEGAEKSTAGVEHSLSG
jgi:hypothetical protein